MFALMDCMTTRAMCVCVCVLCVPYVFLFPQPKYPHSVAYHGAAQVIDMCSDEEVNIFCKHALGQPFE